MPNGGEHFEHVGICPHCDNYRIGTRRRKHTIQVWRCRRCNKTFATPRVVEVAIGPNTNTRGLIFADRIKRMERRARLPMRKPKFSAFQALTVVAVLAVLAVGVWYFANLSPTSAGRERDATPITVAAAITPTPTWATLYSTPTPYPAVLPTDPYHLRHLEAKRFMLELINAERRNVGVAPVVLGDNIAAQIHAESALENCYASHWGIDGLKPYMRYSLAGGYQSNAENGLGSDYCIVDSDGYKAIENVKLEIMDAIEGWMDSPGHRRNMLDASHRKVNIGLAWDEYNFKAYQHFEGDYVEFEDMPTIGDDGTLTLKGTVKNGLVLDEAELSVTVDYDPPPYPLSIGQLSRTYCYPRGQPVLLIVRPTHPGGSYVQESDERKCPDPYEIPPDAPVPISLDASHALWQRAYDSSQDKEQVSIRVSRITANRWSESGEHFNIGADLSKVLSEHGPGVYTVVLLGYVEGDDRVVSEYSIFHEVTPPRVYSEKPENPRPSAQYASVSRGNPH